MSSSRPPRVLCYAPYNRWALHGQWEMTILHALRHRGADVHHVLCDGLYTDCDVFWAATEPRTARSCTMCQAQVAALSHGLASDYRWLGRYLDPGEQRLARAWADGLDRAELRDAAYGDWAVGDWVRASVQSHLRISAIDLDDDRVADAYRSYAYSGLVACFALERLLDDVDPDVLFVFNGRQSSTRVAFELARRRGIRVIVHERGVRKETLQLTENVDAVSLAPFPRYWEDWGDVPLDAGEVETIVPHMLERQHGLGLSWRSFTGAPEPEADVRAHLGLDPERPTWVLYTSSDDEVAGEAGWHGAFRDQFDWIEATVAYAAARPDLDLVVRVHPNTGGRRATGANAPQLERFERMRAALPANVRMVGADEDVSTYTLMDLATVGLVYHSTVALELACKGKATVVAAGNVVEGLPFVRTVGANRDGYEPLLDGLRADVPVAAVDPEVARLAHRFAYGYLYRMPVEFPLVTMPTPHEGRVAWSNTAELAPGLHPELDRCASIVLGEAPVCAPPGPAERARDERAELAAFFPDPARRFTAVAFAEELIADVSLLKAWARTFGSEADATLVIQTPPTAVERLVEAVGRAGADAGDGPDLLAVDAELDALGPVDAVFSRHPVAAVAAPRFDDGSTEDLLALARTRGIAV